MDEFSDDDDAYLDWTERYPDGYVLDSTRPPDPTYLVLHRATCRHVARPLSGGQSWTREMGKWCSVERDRLEVFGAEHGGIVQLCGHCLG